MDTPPRVLIPDLTWPTPTCDSGGHNCYFHIDDNTANGVFILEKELLVVVDYINEQYTQCAKDK